MFLNSKMGRLDKKRSIICTSLAGMEVVEANLAQEKESPDDFLLRIRL